MAGSRRTATRVTPGAICLSSSSHFRAHAVFELHETGGVAARPRQALDEAGADRVGDITNTIGTVRVACCNGRHARGGIRQDNVRRERDQFGGVSANAVGIVRGPAGVNPHVAAVGPAQLLQRLQERREAGLCFLRRPRPDSSARRRAACVRPVARARRAALRLLQPRRRAA